MKGQTVFESVENRHTQGVHPLLGPMDVLFMKSLRCEWGGKCKFCSYWHDNTKDQEEALHVNAKLLHNIQLKTRVVSVSPSASWFDIPELSRVLLTYELAGKIDHLITESTWSYREQFPVFEKWWSRKMPGATLWHKMGIETFDNEVRAKLGKDYIIPDPLDVFKYTNKVILLVGSIYHTRDVIDRDIELGLEHADLLEVNIINDSFSPNKLEDPDLIKYVYTKWAPILRQTPKVVFTEDPASAWGATINPKTIPIKEVR